MYYLYDWTLRHNNLRVGNYKQNSSSSNLYLQMEHCLTENLTSVCYLTGTFFAVQKHLKYLPVADATQARPRVPPVKSLYVKT